MNHVDQMPLVLDFADERATLDAAGGKGMSLTRMVAAGLPVPPGFHVTTAAYRQFVAANGLGAQIEAALAGLDGADTAALEATSARIAGAFAGGTIPAAVAEAVMGAYATLAASAGAAGGSVGGMDGAQLPVAVRSSATAEDLPGASFAGQQETWLNISGAEAVLAAVQRCWASLWTARAIAYRGKQGIDHDGVALAVVVQALVPAAAAGILFTANPLNGRRDEMAINAAWGLGEAVVSGAVTPDTITAAKATGKVVKRETARKLVMTVRDAQGSAEAHVPAAQQGQPVLDDSQVAALVQLGRRIEELYGAPMDVEWTLAGGQLAVVQARPITALPPDWTPPDPKALFARSSLAEHTPSPATPLFGTLGLELANKATERIWQRILGSSAPAVKPIGDMYQVLNGYIFLGVRMNITDLTMFRVAAMSFAQVPWMMRGSVARWQAARSEFAAVVADWEGRPIAPMTPAQLLEGVRSVFGAACRYFTEIQTVLPVAATSEISFTRFYDSLVRGKGDPPATTFLLGLPTQALAAEKALYDLAAFVGADDALADYVRQTPGEQLAADLQAAPASNAAPDQQAPSAQPPAGVSPAAWDAWRERFAAWLAQYGRTIYEFDFSRPTVQETPGPLLETLKAYLAGASESPYARQRDARTKREAATQAVLRRLDGPRKGLFTRLLRWAQETGPMREDSIADMGMGHPLVRRLLGELGRRFAEAGAIQEAGDIYWLEGAEVEQLIAALAAGAPLPDLSARIGPRQAQWRAALAITPPMMIPEKSFWSRFIEGEAAHEQGGKVVLKGAGTSGGRVTAPGRVLFGPEDFASFQPGDVLVAVTTTPAWTPLFALAAAVVTDIGGPLSHSSIVAREYGIPAVMATRSGTRAIRNGQLVTVDGSAGTVTLEE